MAAFTVAMVDLPLLHRCYVATVQRSNGGKSTIATVNAAIVIVTKQ